jgi:enoyl-CoA hydratase/carnithine racemase
MIHATVRDGIAEVAMDRAPANALNLELVRAVHNAHANACSAGARAIILTGRPGMFSGGLDVPELLPQPRAAIALFWESFFQLNQALAASPVPVVAAVSGHAPAGGAVLALHCDYRIGARGPFKIGLNEVAVGLPVPESILNTLAHVVGPRLAHRLAMTAELLPVEDALRVGLLDELAEPERLMERSREWAAWVAALPPIAMSRTRAMARASLLAALDPARDAARATELWFSVETRSGMQSLVERLAKKQGPPP